MYVCMYVCMYEPCNVRTVCFLRWQGSGRLGWLWSGGSCCRHTSMHHKHILNIQKQTEYVRDIVFNVVLALPASALQTGSLAPSSLPSSWLLKNQFPSKREHPFGALSTSSLCTAVALGSRTALALSHSMAVGNMLAEVHGFVLR